MVLAIVALGLIHFNWIFSGAPLISSDWPYFYRDFLQSWWPNHPFWITYDSLGRSITQGNFIALYGVYAGLASLGVSFEMISRWLFFFPALVLAPLGSFFFIRSICHDRFAALAGSLVYSLNTYFIVIQGGHMNLCVAYALAPIIFWLAIQHKRFSIYGLMGVLVMAGFFEIRLMILVAVTAIALYFYYGLRRGKSLGSMVLDWMAIGAFMAAANLFWIIPQLMSGHGLKASAVFSQPALNWVSLVDALTIHHPFWSYRGVTDFVASSPPIILYLLPLLVFSLLLLGLKEHWRDTLFFLGLALISIFMLTQANGPAGNFYQFLYSHIPAMSAFRESSKFFLLTAISYGVLAGLAIVAVQRRFGLRGGVAVGGLLAVVMLIPLAPYLGGSYVKAFRATKITAEIKALGDFIAQDRYFYRTLWLSRTPKFVPFSTVHPNLDALTIGQGSWADYSKDSHNPFGYLQNQTARAILNFSSVRYLIAPEAAVGGDYANYANLGPDFFHNIVKANFNFEQVAVKGIKSSIWENKESKDHLYIADNTTLVDGSIVDYSGIDAGRNNAYVFSEQLRPGQLQQLSGYFQNKEINPYKVDSLTVSPGTVTGASTALYDSKDQYQMYMNLENSPLKNLIVRRTGSIISFETANVWDSSSRKKIYDFDARKQSDNQLVIAVNDSSYMFAVGELKTGQEKVLGSVSVLPSNNEVVLYRPLVAGKSVISNPSFELGLWRKPNDCSNIDNTNLEKNGIKASLTSDASAGGKSLKLEGRRHLACMVTTFKPQPGAALYYFAYDYKTLSGGAPYAAIYQGSTESQKAAEVFYGEQSASTSWRTSGGFYSAAAGSNISSIFLYAPSTEGRLSASLFDNLRLTSFAVAEKTTYNEDKLGGMYGYKKQPFDARSPFQLTSNLITGRNLYPDGSFEHNTDVVPGDCNNNDRTTLDQNGIKATLTNDAADGSKALVLSARQHIACVSQRLMDFDKNYDYLISFDYKQVSGAGLEFSLYPRSEEPFNRRIKVPATTQGKWQNYQTMVKSGQLADQMSLIFYLPAKGDNASKALLDNVRVYKIPRLPHVYLQTDNKALSAQALATKQSAPTAYKLETPSFTAPRVLVFSESFNTGWRARLVKHDGNNTRTWTIPDAYHLAVNGYANGWAIDPAKIPADLKIARGDYRIVVDYKPQGYAMPAALLSWALGVGVIMMLVLRRRRVRQ